MIKMNDDNIENDIIVNFKNQKKLQNKKYRKNHKIMSIGMKSIKDIINFNEYLIQKRDDTLTNLTFALPFELYYYIKSEKNRGLYIANILKKYEIFLNKLPVKEIFFNIASLVRFFLYLDYFEYTQDLEINIKRKYNEVEYELNKTEKKDGIFTIFENNKEYLCEYENYEIKTKKEIKRVIK